MANRPSSGARVAAASLALLVCACSSAGDCLPPGDSAERVEFRQRLAGLIHRSQCHGPPTPRAFEAQEGEVARRESALLARVRNSPLAQDLERAIREDEEFSRNVNEAECRSHDFENPDSPRNVAEFRAGLEGERKQVREAEAAFARLVAQCAAG
ncbi:MAG TPA: hypothetical protein VGA98_11715 [Allosphingosinicella sp.]|jgi:hypothetical protein